jgi:alkylation response protein AidB-like acyl-CoA dehydrogenase
MKELGPDFYNIPDLLTEEELLIQKTAYDFVQTEFMPVINEHYENSTFPMDLVPKLGEMGFMGSSLPEESGGAGVSNVADGLIYTNWNEAILVCDLLPVCRALWSCILSTPMVRMNKKLNGFPVWALEL